MWELQLTLYLICCNQSQAMCWAYWSFQQTLNILVIYYIIYTYFFLYFILMQYRMYLCVWCDVSTQSSLFIHLIFWSWWCSTVLCTVHVSLNHTKCQKLLSFFFKPICKKKIIHASMQITFTNVLLMLVVYKKRRNKKYPNKML
jgi:hypothetical protein